MVEVQTWLNELIKKEEVKELSISPYTADSQNENSFKIKLTGCLIINDFVVLKKLYLYDDELAKLIIINCPEIELINCAGNLLTDLVFLVALDPKKLTVLYLENNNILEQDLSCFGGFINLTALLIGNSDHSKIGQGIYNRFTGSLEFLQNLTSLERLSIENTDIDSGLEYLPSTVQEFHCSAELRAESRVKRIAKELKPFLISSFHGTYDFNGWKRKKESGLAILSEPEQIYNVYVCSPSPKKRKSKISQKEIEYQESDLEVNNSEQEPEARPVVPQWKKKNICIKPDPIVRSRKNWSNISQDFENSSELAQEWQKKGFSYEECKKWIDGGLKITDADFCAWLRDIKKVDAEWVLNNGDTETLRNEFQAKKANEIGKEQQQLQWIETNFYQK